MVADSAEDLLKVARVGRAYPQDAVCLARDCVRLSNFRDGADHLAHPVRRHPALAVDLNKGLDRPAQRSRLNFGCKAPDHTAMTEPIHPSFRGCGREAYMMPEHRKALATVVCQPRKDLVINFVKTQYSILAFIEHTIGLARSGTLPFQGDNHSAEPHRAPRSACATSALSNVSADLFRCDLFHQSVDGPQPPR
jgi:hypothetical protein